MDAPPACKPAGSARAGVVALLRPSRHAFMAAAGRARMHGTTVEAELISAGTIDEADYYRAVARHLGLRFLESIDPSSVVISSSVDMLLREPHRPLLIDWPAGGTVKVIAPEPAALERLATLFARHGGLRPAFAITTPRAVREAIWQARSRQRVDETVRHLFETQRNASARIVATGLQGFLLGSALTAFLAGLVFLWDATLQVSHLCLTLLFGAVVWLRINALLDWRPPPRLSAPPDDSELPHYTVMVALYREGGMVGQLVRALDAIDWPRAKLDVKIVCEAGDRQTLDALERMDLRPEYEVVEVPRVPPFTKPKALSYAISGARGEFLVVYDAEDRPHPLQLREAHARFRIGGPRLASIQAPLMIANPGRSWLTALFALEYAVLFRGLLPFLARNDLPLPLGGTSNHFRTRILRDIGAWDPFNVTEDADLGFRLASHGYRLDVISLPTLESAPARIGVWMGQRSRWFKGWMQTWLVTMRRPRRQPDNLGLVRVLSFQIMTVGLLAAALLSPFMLYFMGSATAEFLSSEPGPTTIFGTVLRIADLFILAATFACFVLLGRRAMLPSERRHVGWRWLLLPAYWLLMTLAAWRALHELVRRPFHWEKTPHNPTARAGRD